MRRRLTLSALATLFAAALAVTGNATTASADSSAPPLSATKYSLHEAGLSAGGWNGPDSASTLGWNGPDFAGGWNGPDVVSSLGGWNGPDSA